MIHPTALISPAAELGNNPEVGPFTIIHGKVQIGNNVVIGSHCEIGHPSVLADGKPLLIGDDALIRSHSIFYQGSTFGRRLVTGHRVTVREQTVAGENFQIGTLSDVQGHCCIGDYVRFHSNVHIGQSSDIGDFVWIFPYVVLTNDPHPPSNVLLGVRVDDYAAIATMSVILPGVTIGSGALVGAHSSVGRDVAPDTVVAGVPAKLICNAADIKLKDGTGKAAYPWRNNFHRGYPKHLVELWLYEANERAKI